MCGIYGVAGKDLVNEVDLLDSVHKLEHRGPDDFGYYISDGISIGMRRLAINELSTGHQPFITDEKTLGVVFNGEIYNHSDLRRELEISGRAPSWRGTSDTETLLACFAAWDIETTRTSEIGGMKWRCSKEKAERFQRLKCLRARKRSCMRR